MEKQVVERLTIENLITTSTKSLAKGYILIIAYCHQDGIQCVIIAGDIREPSYKLIGHIKCVVDAK